MRPWVRPLLEELGVHKEELEQNIFIWRRIGNLFTHEFGNDSMTELLGSVICNLPRDIFGKIFKVNPFFILVKGPALVQQIYTSGEVPLVMFCQTDLRDMSFSQRQATVAHELAHIALDHNTRPFSLSDPYKEQMQKEADDLSREWGFEIDNVRNYLKQKGG